MAAWLENFWLRLGTQVAGAPDHIFLKDFMQFTWGPLRLEVFNTDPGTAGIPRELVLALVDMMVVYTQRGFCGMFHARASSKGVGAGGAKAGIKLWIVVRIVEDFIGV